METKYIFSSLSKNKKEIIFSQAFSKKKDALDVYSQMCENNPQEHFRVTRQQILEDTIAESDDYRQVKFAFAN